MPNEKLYYVGSNWDECDRFTLGEAVEEMKRRFHRAYRGVYTREINVTGGFLTCGLSLPFVDSETGEVVYIAEAEYGNGEILVTLTPAFIALH